MTIEEAKAANIGQCAYEDCWLVLLPERVWAALSIEEQDEIKRDGYGKNESRRLCTKHNYQARKDGTLNQYAQVKRPTKFGPDRPAPVRPLVERFDFPALYIEAVESEASDPVAYVVDHTGATRQHVQRLLRLAGVDYTRQPRGYSQLKAARIALVEEVEFLASCGRGLAEIAQKVGLSVETLIERFDHYRKRGHTKLVLRFEDRPEFPNQYTNH